MIQYPTYAEALRAQRERIGADTVARVQAFARLVASAQAPTLDAPSDLFDAMETAFGCWPTHAPAEEGIPAYWFLGNRRFMRSDVPRDHLLLHGRVIFRS